MGNRTEIISPANEQYENRSKLLRYHNKQEPLRMQRKRRSGIQAEYKRQHRIQLKQRSGIQAEYKRQHRMRRSGIQVEYKRHYRIQRKQRSGIQAEYKRQRADSATYPERELRRIVCWLLILSAEI